MVASMHGQCLVLILSPIKSKANGLKSSKEQSPARDTEWIRADVNPLLEGITLDAPLSVITGETVKVVATGNQAGNLNFPLRYPASVNWIGSENVFIGIGEEFEKAKKSKDTMLFSIIKLENLLD